MEVTRFNWLQFLNEFERLLNHTVAVSIDTEFKSATIPGHISHILESMDTKYKCIREVCTRYPIKEVGITLILRTSSDKSFNLKSWSIPCGKDGIPCMRMSQITQLYFDLKQNPFKKVDPLKSLTAKCNRKCSRAIQMLNGNYEPLVILPTMNKISQRIIATMCPQWVIASRDVPDGVPSMVAFRDAKFMNPQAFSRYQGGIGCIMKILVEKCRNIPIVTHNGILDVAFLWNHCVWELPSSRDIFCQDVYRVFPRLFDTKYNMIKYSSLDLNIMKSTDLTTCYHSSLVSLNDMKRQGRDTLLITGMDKEGSLHQAWWDSYMTAVVYLFLQNTPVSYTPVENRFHMMLSTENWCWDGSYERQHLYIYILYPFYPGDMKTAIYNILRDEPKPFIDTLSYTLTILTWKEDPSRFIDALSSLGAIHIYHHP